jgi:hypothetical protein
MHSEHIIAKAFKGFFRIFLLYNKAYVSHPAET